MNDERSAIIHAAHRLIGRSGTAATPIESILRVAGVNRRIFYRHFPSKDALVLAMQQQAGEIVQAALRGAVDATPTARAGAVAWLEEMLRIGWDERRAREGRTFLTPEVRLIAGATESLEEIYANQREILADVLRRGCADGTIETTEPDRDAFALQAVVLRILEMRIRGRLDVEYDKTRDDVVALFTALTKSGPG